MEKKADKRIMEWIKRLQGGFCLFLIVFGISICMESVLSIRVPWQMRLVVTVVVMLLAELSSFGIWWLLSAVLIFAGAFTVICICYQQMLQAGWLQFVNRVLEMINEYYRTDYLLFYLEEEESHAFLIVLLITAMLGFLEGLLLMAGRKRKCHFLIASILPVLVITAGLLVGFAPGARGILLMFIGLVAEIFDFRERGRILIFGMLALGVGLPFFLLGNGEVWEPVLSLNEDWQKRQLVLEDRMLETVEKISDISLFSQGEQKQYSLNNEEPEYTGKEVFRITVDYPIYNPVYLRGFVGGEYENGTWKRISRQEFSDWTQAMGSDEQTYARTIQSFPYEFAAWTAADSFTAIGWEKHVSIQLKQELKGYTLMPYFSKIPKEQPLKADGILPPGKSTQFEWDSFLNLSKDEIDLADGFYMGEFASGDEMDRDSQIWNSYKEYIETEYQKLPEEGLEELRAYVREHENDLKAAEEIYEEIQEKFAATGKTSWTYSEMEEIFTNEELALMTGGESWKRYDVRKILELLWKDNRYSFDLDRVPQGRDIVAYFLLEQHKGYCVHFASAATLLLQMNGIPARYASGYIIMPSDFKKNEDGTWTAVVTDERAHAWTEVFYDNIGFCPVETTPPEYTVLLGTMEEEQTLEGAVEEKEREYEQRHPQETQKREEQMQQPQVEQNTGNVSSGKDKQESDLKDQNGSGTVSRTETGTGRTSIIEFLYQYRRIWISAGLTILAAAALYLFIHLRRNWVLKERQRRFEQGNRSQAVCEMGKELGKILKLMGTKRMSGMDDREFQQLLGYEMPEIGWEQAFLIFRKAKYSEQKITEDEYGKTADLYRSMEQKLTGKGKVRDWYIRYVKIYS